MQKLKKPVSILLVFMMIVSLFAAVPMTVNAAPPGSETEGHALTLYANNGTDQQYTTEKNFLGILLLIIRAIINLQLLPVRLPDAGIRRQMEPVRIMRLVPLTVIEQRI